MLFLVLQHDAFLDLSNLKSAAEKILKKSFSAKVFIRVRQERGKFNKLFSIIFYVVLFADYFYIQFVFLIVYNNLYVFCITGIAIIEMSALSATSSFLPKMKKST